MKRLSASETNIDQNIINRRFVFLLVSRAARSTALIFANLSIPLYLLAIHYSIVSIGIIYIFVALATTGVSLFIGLLGDRIGFRKAMIIGEIPALFLTSVLFLTTDHSLIIVGIVLSGSAGAAGGLRGAFSPGINAYIATNWPDTGERVRRMALVTSIASAFSIAGSLMLYFYDFVERSYGEIGAFRILYFVCFLLVLISFISLFFLKERKTEKKTNRVMNRQSSLYTIRVLVSNAINGSGLGLSIVLLPAWFELRYGIDTSEVGLVFLFSYLGTSIGSLVASRMKNNMISARPRTLRTASYTRIIQGLLMVVVAVSPLLPVAAVLYAARSFVAGIGAPNRTTVNVSGISSGDYGAATSLQGVSSRVSQSFSGLSGYLMDVSLPLPLVAGGILQSISGAVYYKLLKQKNS